MANMVNPRILILPANIVEENIKQLEHSVQHMGKAVTYVAKLIIFTQFVFEENLILRHQGQ